MTYVWLMDVWVMTDKKPQSAGMPVCMDVVGVMEVCMEQPVARNPILQDIRNPVIYGK